MAVQGWSRRRRTRPPSRRVRPISAHPAVTVAGASTMATLRRLLAYADEVIELLDGVQVEPATSVT